ncbi:hypothetical protein [Kitasatospora sp. NPDC001683]
MRREIAERLPDRPVRRRPRAQQALELVGGGDLEDAERAEDIGPQRGGRTVRVRRPASDRDPSQPGRLRLRWIDGVGLVVATVGLDKALTGARGRLPVVVVAR